MKKVLIASTILSFATLSSAFAATEGTLLLQGQIDPVLSLSVAGETGVHDDLDLTASPTGLKVAEVSENSNAANGYKIEVKSDNASSLKNGTLDSVAYTLSYGAGGPVTLTTSYQEVKNAGVGGVYNVTEDVTISYTGRAADQLAAGTYSDTVTFSISAN